MDTNINNYDTIELLNVLKIPNHKEPQLAEGIQGRIRDAKIKAF